MLNAQAATHRRARARYTAAMNPRLQQAAAASAQLDGLTDWVGSVRDWSGRQDWADHSDAIDSTCCRWGWDWCCASNGDGVPVTPTVPVPPVVIPSTPSTMPAWVVPAAVGAVGLGAVYMLARGR